MPKKNVLKPSSEVFVPRGLDNIIDDNLIGSVGGKGDVVNIKKHGKAHIEKKHQVCTSEIRFVPLNTVACKLIEKDPRVICTTYNAFKNHVASFYTHAFLLKQY